MAISYLKLVHDRPGTLDPSKPIFEHVQESLLSSIERTMAICTADGLSDAILRTLIETLRPRLILDYRTAPRFDFGSLNRGKALDLFDAIGARYLDVGYALPHGADDTKALADALVEYAKPLALDTPNASALALVDAGIDFERAGLIAIQQLREHTKLVWELLLFGPAIFDHSQRNIIFISHANPEDNEVALWLQTQLTRLGYETWSDITHLKAGEIFWDSIEDAIRNKAARVISLVSRKSMQKPGVLDEISLAVSVERTRNLKGFVIPVRVDDVPYSDFRANIARKNIVDLSSSWASGLAKLNAALLHDRLPRLRQVQGLSLASWWDERKPTTLSVIAESESLTSNKFQLTTVPIRIYSYSGAPEFQAGDVLPLIPFKDRWLSFFSENELVKLGIKGVKFESTISMKDFFSGNLNLTSHISDAARQRLFHRMLNRQWDIFLINRGLKLYAESGIRPITYIPDGLLTNNIAHFLDSHGVSRKRILVGYSTKKSLYWHLAPVGFFQTSACTTLNLKLRILFSSDGQGQWPSVEKMRTMRRTFCKNWWNDRWRSLQSAFSSWLSDGKQEISIYSGDGGSLVLQSSAISYESPISIREAHLSDEEASQSSEPDEGSENSIDDWADLEYDESDAPGTAL